MENTSLTTIEKSLMTTNSGKVIIASIEAIKVIGTGIVLYKIVDLLSGRKSIFKISYKDASIEVSPSPGVSA